MPCRTVLVIPCYNEAARLRPERFRAFLSAHPEVSLLFVDDGSTDGTAEALEGFEVLRLARNRGKGEAVRQGVLHCLSSGRAPDYIGFLDADLAVDPCEATRLTEALEEEPAAWMACASRWRRLGAEIRRKPLRAALGRLMAALQLILGDFFARRLLVGFPELVDAVDAMASGDFSRRVRSLGPDEELTRLADAVNQMAANTEGLLAELKAVTDNVAHDLRTPITRLRARAELAMRTGRTAKLPGEVAEECDGLLRFIATALCVSRLSHGLDVGESVEADAARLAEELAELYAVSAEMRRVALVCDLPAGEGCPCVLNVPLVRRALGNLLDNALKFTPAGGRVTICVRVEAAWVAFAVEDTGRGIGAEALGHVFDRFWTGERGKGYGLGLSLVKAVATALGGEVAVASAPGEGSVFTLRLPRWGRAKIAKA